MEDMRIQPARSQTPPARTESAGKKRMILWLSFLNRRGGLPLLRHFGGRLLHAGIGAGGKLGLEFFNPAGRIDVFQLAGEEWMASRANIDLQLFLRAAGLERV